MAVNVKQSTAVLIPLGPFVSAADGTTISTGLTISQADVRLSKNGAAFAQKNDANSATHMENGVYQVRLDTTDTNTLGHLKLLVNESGALASWLEIMVLPANVWDSFYGADSLKVEVVEISGDTTAADNAELFFDGTGYAGGTTKLDVNVVSISGDTTAADNAEAFFDGTGYAGTGNVIPTVTSVTNRVTANTDQIEGVDATNQIRDSILNDATRFAGANIDTALSNLATQTSVNTIDDFLDTEIAAIKAKTDSLTFTGANRVDANVTAVNNDTSNIAGFDRSIRTIGRATATAGSSTSVVAIATSVPTLSAADQVKGRIIIFDLTTTTTTLRGQASDITANSTTTVTVTALTTSPVEGDTFAIL